MNSIQYFASILIRFNFMVRTQGTKSEAEISTVYKWGDNNKNVEMNYDNI